MVPAVLASALRAEARARVEAEEGEGRREAAVKRWMWVVRELWRRVLRVVKGVFVLGFDGGEEG